jgi:hypothetical protein
VGRIEYRRYDVTCEEWKEEPGSGTELCGLSYQAAKELAIVKRSTIFSSTKDSSQAR